MLNKQIHNIHHAVEAVGLRGEIRSSVLYMITLKYLLDILVEMYSRQGKKMQHDVVVQAQILGLGSVWVLNPVCLSSCHTSIVYWASLM